MLYKRYSIGIELNIANSNATFILFFLKMRDAWLQIMSEFHNVFTNPTYCSHLATKRTSFLSLFSFSFSLSISLPTAFSRLKYAKHSI